MSANRMIDQARRLCCLARGPKARAVPSYLRAWLRGSRGGRIAGGVKISGPGTLVMEPDSSIGAGTRIYIGPGATLRMGRASRLSDRCVVNATVGVTLGARARVSWDVHILDSDFHSVTRADGSESEPTAPVVVEDGAFVGARSMILKGVTIGREAVVGAGSVVPKSVPARTIVAGNPARVIGQGSRTDLVSDPPGHDPES